MGNKNAGGPFSPLVNITRNIVGKKEFNKFRGKMISLHSQGSATRTYGCCCLSYMALVFSAQLAKLMLKRKLNFVLPGCAVIKAFGAQVGANYKQVEGLIRVAKKNGEKLGFLA